MLLTDNLQIMVGKDAENFDPTEMMAKMSTRVPTREDIQQHLESLGENALLMDGFDEAVIGFSQRINEPMLAVYSWDKMMDTCMKRDGMTWDEAEEYISYNCIGAWVGEQTPIIVMPVLY